MNQMNLFNFIKYDDPIFIKIRRLKENEEIVIDESLGIKATLNWNGIYEAVSEEFHESFSDYEKCYEFISEYLNKIQFGNEVYL